MKKLSIEEKAKAYEQALKVAQQTYETQPVYRDWLEKMFPELKESGGERTRKKLIDLIYKVYANTSYITCVEHEDMLAWLSKQGVKPDGWNDKDEEIRQELIEMIKEDWPGRSDVIAWIEKQKERNTNTHLPSFDEAQGTPIVKQGEQKPWSEEDETRLNTICGILKGLPLQQNWLKNLKYRVQPKQEWSEEDESYLNTTIAYLKDAKEFKKTAENCIIWLKSLRPQLHWKPSENELEVLRLVAEKDGTCLMGLYEKLKAYSYESKRSTREDMDT